MKKEFHDEVRRRAKRNHGDVLREGLFFSVFDVELRLVYLMPDIRCPGDQADAVHSLCVEVLGQMKAATIIAGNAEEVLTVAIEGHLLAIAGVERTPLVA